MTVVGVLARRDVALRVADLERRGAATGATGKALANRMRQRPRARARGRHLLLVRRQRLSDLAVVAVDRDRLQTQLPGLDEELLDLLDRGVLRHVHGLGDRAGDERLRRRHHADVTHVVDRLALPSTCRTPGSARSFRCGASTTRVVLGDVSDDVLDLLGVVAELVQRSRHRLVHDLHRAAADELLRLHQREVGLDARSCRSPSSARSCRWARAPLACALR